MATKRELEEICIDATEQFLEEYDVRERLPDWPVGETFPAADIGVGAGERFQTRFAIGSPTESHPVSFSTRGSTADFAMWLDTGQTYDEFDEGVFQPDCDDPVRQPLLVAELVGEDYTQQHFPSTSEQTFDESDSPYSCWTNLPYFQHQVHNSGLLLISDFEVDLLPAHADAGVLASDDGVSELAVRDTIRISLSDVLLRASGREFDVRDDV